MLVSCSSNNDNSPEKWSEKKISEWFNEGKWKEDWEPRPDESINQKKLAYYYFQNPERWKKAFSFLKREDLSRLQPGRYELDGADLFLIIDEYNTKNEEDSRFEAHRKYADIQYLIYGEEKIGIISLKETRESVPYDKEKDIVFLTAKENNYRLAWPEKFFIFFPEDAHRPSVKTDKNSIVRKAVVKVRID